MTDLLPKREVGRPLGSGKPAVERFWPKVDVRGPDDCWPWRGSVSGGHGCFRVDTTRRVSACGFAAETRYGYPCPPGKETQHTHAGMSLCMNPAHLVYGKPGRSLGSVGSAVARRGEGSHFSKLTDRQVAEIRRRWAAGERGATLARDAGVTQGYISRIVNHHARRHPTISPEPRRPAHA